MKGTYRGCSEPIPYCDATTPVMKGRIAEPACPRPAIHPTEPVTSHCGNTFVVCDMTRGYIGPMNNPITATYNAQGERDHVDKWR